MDVWTRFFSAVPGRRFGVTLVLSFIAVLCYLSPALASAFQFEQAAVAGGEVWRILTCHLTHWNFDHLFWDLSMFLVLGAIIETEDRSRFLLCLTVSAIAIPLMVWLVNPEISAYRGLSGVDSALFILLMTQTLRESQQQSKPLWAGAAGIGMLALLAKTLYEVQTGATLFVDHEAAGMIPLPISHLVGGITGFLTTVCPLPNRRSSGQKSSLHDDRSSGMDFKLQDSIFSKASTSLNRYCEESDFKLPP